LAAEILALKEDDPELRIFLVAHSGGTGIAVRAAEMLPPDCLERVVLLSSALSPEYDLSAALRSSKGGIVSYHSALDFLVLGLGTWQFGTVDRTYVASAGHTGFREPAHLDGSDRALYGRLVQVPWSPRMIRYGNWGTHNGTVFPAFLAGEVARWLR
jgi:pimeloyl-ACP methyl ester carboxylesterase